MKTSTQKTMFISVAGIALMGSMAGCAPSNTSGAGQSSASNQASTAQGGSSASSGTYKDGTYKADGKYVSPNGQETIGVQLTLSSGVVSALQLTPYPSNPNTQKFQGEFISGINAVVVGKPIDELNVSKISGSSLTSGGFNDAISQIKKEATS